MYTQSEHVRANRIASQMDFSQINPTTDPLVKEKLIKRQQKGQSIISIIPMKNVSHITN